jgi:Flp pilus assembly protein TadD
MFLTIGDLDYAVHCLLKAVDIDCANADAYYYLGVVSAKKGAFEHAAEFFANALDIKPKDVRALHDCAVVYLAMGRLANAAENISEARSLAHGDSQLRALDYRVRMGQLKERANGFLWWLRPRFVTYLATKAHELLSRKT